MTSNALPVLVIESHPDVLAAMHASLEFEGYRVLTASSVREATVLLRQGGRPGLVLMDEMLERAGRERLLDVLAPAGVSVVLLTVRDEAPSPGVTAFLRKPFTLDMLLNTVATHCERRGTPRLSVVPPLDAGAPEEFSRAPSSRSAPRRLQGAAR